MLRSGFNDRKRMVFWILEMLSYHLFFQQCVPVLLWFPSLAFPPPPGLDAAGFDRSGGFFLAFWPHRKSHIDSST